MSNEINIPLFRVYMPEDVDKRLKGVVESGYVAEGEHVHKFEKLLGEFAQNENVIATNSCTSALHLSLVMAKKPGDGFVITTPMTCVATNVSITNLGMTPVWTDVDPKNGMMTADSLRDAWTILSPSTRKRVSAVIYVLWGGDVGNLVEVDALCQKLGVPLIIDAAQGFSSKIKGVPVPAKCGDYIAYSFQAIKHITTGDGGALFLRDPDNLKRASILKWFGIDRDGFRTPTGEINWKADIPEIGYKFHMNNITAAIGIAQLEDPKLRYRLDLYNKNAVYIENNLNRDDCVKADTTPGSANWVYTAHINANVDQLITDLKEKGIDSSRMHIRNDIYTGFKGYTPSVLSGLEEFEDNHICLPCGWWVSEQDCKYIVKSVKECLDKQRK